MRLRWVTVPAATMMVVSSLADHDREAVRQQATGLRRLGKDRLRGDGGDVPPWS